MTNLTDTFVTVNMGILGSIVKRVTHWVLYFSYIKLISNIVESDYLIRSMWYWNLPISDRRHFETTQDFGRNRKNFDHWWGIQKVEIFIGTRISECLRRAQRYDNFKRIKLIRITQQSHLPSRLSWQNRTWHIRRSSKNRCPHCRCHHLGYSHHHTIWYRSTFEPRPEQSQFLPEACSPNITDNKQQRQRWTKCPPPEPSDILKRYHKLL